MDDQIFSAANNAINDGARVMEDDPFILPWLAAWAAIIGFCAVVWATVYKLALLLAHLLQ